jgi:hypothetical protein
MHWLVVAGSIRPVATRLNDAMDQVPLTFLIIGWYCTSNPA